MAALLKSSTPARYHKALMIQPPIQYTTFFLRLWPRLSQCSLGLNKGIFDDLAKKEILNIGTRSLRHLFRCLDLFKDSVGRMFYIFMHCFRQHAQHPQRSNLEWVCHIFGRLTLCICLLYVTQIYSQPVTFLGDLQGRKSGLGIRRRENADVAARLKLRVTFFCKHSRQNRQLFPTK